MVRIRVKTSAQGDRVIAGKQYPFGSSMELGSVFHLNASAERRALNRKVRIADVDDIRRDDKSVCQSCGNSAAKRGRHAQRHNEWSGFLGLVREIGQKRLRVKIVSM